MPSAGASGGGVGVGVLDARRIVVTGGASGMGAASVRAYVREGARVFSMDLDAEAGAHVAEQAAKEGPGEVRFEACNISTPEAVAVMERGIDWLGGIDVLANVAGVERRDTPEAVTEEEMDFLLETNFWGTVQTNQIAYTHMAGRGGRIINYGSAAGLGGMPMAAAYSASKGAILGWSRTIAQEWLADGIAVIALCPMIWTPMYEGHRERNPETAPYSDAILRGSDPDRDMGPVMVFLATTASFGVYGQHIDVTRPPGVH